MGRDVVLTHSKASTAPASPRKRLRAGTKSAKRAGLLSTKQALTVLGTRLPDGVLHASQMAVNYLRLGRWMRTHGFDFPVRFDHRRKCFELIAERTRGQRVLYLEFGVHGGQSMRVFSRLIESPDAELHGFDSFLGLPEEFDAAGGYPKGRFSTDGEAPEIDDPRVSFHKGWFKDTVPSFELPEHEALVINMDADLYSSTILVLQELRDAFRPGTILYFDDLSRPEHEAKAFDEFLNETGLRFRALCADRSLNHAAFECLG